MDLSQPWRAAPVATAPSPATRRRRVGDSGAGSPRRHRAGTKYVIKDQSHKPEGIFALPAIKTPSGIVVSQTAAICHVLGHELGLAPADAAADAKALQICCDAVDFITEATKPDFASDRKQKWLTHFAAVTSADAPVNYSDFLLFTALELAISSFTAAVDESELPDGLGAWWNKICLLYTSPSPRDS